MQHVRVNGFTLSSADGEETRTRVVTGKDRRNDRNRPLPALSRSTTAIEGKTPSLPVEIAKAVSSLVTGFGHVINFEDATPYTSRGIGPSSATTATTTAGGARFGSRYGNLRAAVYDLQLPEQWTVILWHLSVGTWRHHVLRWDGARWYEGVRGDGVYASTQAALLTIDNGAITFGPTSVQSFDDIVALPYHVPDEMIAAFYAFAVDDNRPFPPLPQVEVDGGVIAGRRMMSIGASLTHQAAAAGADSARREVEFLLAAVNPTIDEQIIVPKPLASFLWNDGVTQTSRVSSTTVVATAALSPQVYPVGRGGWSSLLMTSLQYLTIPHAAALAITGDVSFAAWVWWSGGGPAVLISKSPDAPTPGAMATAYQVAVDATGRVVFSQAVAADLALVSLSSTRRIKRGGWSLVVVSRKANFIRVTIDGIPEAIGFIGPTPEDSGAQVSLMCGKPLTSSPFLARVGPLALWNTSLTPQETMALWHAGVQSTPFPVLVRS